MRNPVGVSSQSFSGVRASTALINTNNPAEEKYHPLLSVLPKHTTRLPHTLGKSNILLMVGVKARDLHRSVVI